MMKKILGIVMLCAIAGSAMAMPARRGGVVRTAEDGTEKIVYLHGDAFSHYMTDRDGKWLNEKSLEPMSEAEKSAAMKAHNEKRRVRRIQQKKMIGTEPNIAPRGLLIMVNFKNKEFTIPRDTVDSMMNGAHFTRSYRLDYEYPDDYGDTHRILKEITSEGM